MTNIAPPAKFCAQDAIRLLEYPERLSSSVHSPDFDKKVTEAKALAVETGDQNEAKLFWLAQSIAKAHRSFQKAFDLMKEYKFYEAWCELERCEITVAALKQHLTVEVEDPHRIDYIQVMVERWQSLFPYVIFFSPEILKKRVECSICGERVLLRNTCGHEKGEIYNGEDCYHIVTDCDFLSVSIVENPVQKYSVGFLANEDGSASRDQYNYATVRFVIDRLSSAFHGWDSEKQTRTFPINAVAHISPDSSCPCTSGNAFSICCAVKPAVEMPHLQFRFYVPPPPDMPTFEVQG